MCPPTPLPGYSPSALTALLEAGSAAAPPPDALAVVRVSGPEPGYDATSKIVAACVATMLAERGQMGVASGVVTPGAAFRGTGIIQRLTDAGVGFTVVSPPATIPSSR